MKVNSGLGKKMAAYIILLTLLATFIPISQQKVSAQLLNLTQYVDPFIDSAGRQVEPNAMVPFGMVTAGPNTVGGGDNARYAYYDTTIKHFDLDSDVYASLFSFMPVTVDITTSPYSDGGRYDSTFTHGGSYESAEPGYYQVKLNDFGDTNVELTATKRTSIIKTTYPSGTSHKGMVFYASGGEISIDAANRKIYGYAHATRKQYFVAYFDKAFSSFGTFENASVSPGNTSASGNTGAFVKFNDDNVQMKTAMSYVSVANADGNLASEQSGWNFASVKNAASSSWNEMLNKVVVTDNGTPNDREKFYTFLYTALKHPHIFSDYNGQYRGADGTTKTASGYTKYSNLPLWDQYRTQFPLLAMLVPSVAEDIIQSLLSYYDEKGGFFTYGRYHEDANKANHGDSSDVFISTAYSFGVDGFDANRALNAMIDQSNKKLPDVELRVQINDYLSKGYVPYDKQSNAASISLEYYQNDFAIAWLAGKLGDNARWNEYIQRANRWLTIFDDATKYIRPKHSNGSWLSSFAGNTGTGYFYEGTASQYTWFINWNVAELVSKKGGRFATSNTLNSYFSSLESGIGSYNMWIGNEHTFTNPYLYNWTGEPYKSHSVVRRALNESFEWKYSLATPGEEDYGAMSSWYVWAAMGIYPAIQGTDALLFSAPLFPSVTITLENGNTIQINAPGATHTTPYITNLTVDGASHNKPWIWFHEISDGATLNFTVSATASLSWGSGASSEPPSYGVGSSPPVANEAALTLLPVADAYVRDGIYADNSYGTATTLELKEPLPGYHNYRREAFFRFDTTSIGQYNSVKLRLYGGNIADNADVDVHVYAVDQDSWTESITWNSRPSMVSLLDTVTVNGTQKFYEFDVTSFVGTQNAVSLGIRASSSGTLDKLISFNSREHGLFKPELVVESEVTVLHPIVDAFVRDGVYANNSYGMDTTLVVKEPLPGYNDYRRYAFLRFDTSGIHSYDSATLRLYGGNTMDGATVTLEIYSVNDNGWTEAMTWNTKPALATLLDTGAVNGNQQVYEFDVTGFVNTQNLVSLGIRASTSGTIDKTITLHSRENANFKPELVLQ